MNLNRDTLSSAFFLSQSKTDLQAEVIYEILVTLLIEVQKDAASESNVKSIIQSST